MARVCSPGDLHRIHPTRGDRARPAGAVWYIPGHSQPVGTYTGLGEVFDFWRRVAEMSDHGMRLQVLDVLATDERAAVFVHGRAYRGIRVLEEQGVHHVRLRAELERGGTRTARL